MPIGILPILGVCALFLTWYNTDMRLKRFVKGNWRTLLFATLGGAVGVAFISMLRVDVPLATSMVAFGTLLLAIVTAMTIDNSRRQEERRRQDELAKEKRLRDERLLDEIGDWALAVVNSSFGGEVTTIPGMGAVRQAVQNLENNILKCQELWIKGEEYIKPIALSISQELGNNTRQLTDSLNVLHNNLYDRRKNIGDAVLRERTDEIEQALAIVGKALIKKVAEHKIRQIL